MNKSHNPLVTEQTRQTNRTAQLETLMFGTAVSKAMQALAEQNLAQTREAYEQSRQGLETALQTLERSFDAVSQGATALNRKVLEIAKRNFDSGFDLAKALAGAGNLAEMIELQAAYWRKQFDTLGAQAEEVRLLSTQVAADAAKAGSGASETRAMRDLQRQVDRS